MTQVAFLLYACITAFLICCFISDGKDDEWCEDELSWNGSDGELDPSSDLDREWQRRKKQFHSVYSEHIQIPTYSLAYHFFAKCSNFDR